MTRSSTTLLVLLTTMFCTTDSRLADPTVPAASKETQPSAPAIRTDTTALSPPVVHTDGAWKSYALLDNTYHVAIPGEARWEQQQLKRYAAYEVRSVHGDLTYDLWVHHYPPEDTAHRDPQHLHDRLGAIGLTHGQVIRDHQAVDTPHSEHPGRRARFTYQDRDGTQRTKAVFLFRNDRDVMTLAISGLDAAVTSDALLELIDGFRKVVSNNESSGLR